VSPTEARIRCPAPGALAEWLGSGLQSRLQRFESARRLYSNGTEPVSPWEVADTLHRPLVVQPAKVDLSHLWLPVAEKPLQGF
jgi:hypothetical protein